MRHRGSLLGAESAVSVEQADNSQRQFGQPVSVRIHENSCKNMMEYIQTHAELVVLVG